MTPGSIFETARLRGRPFTGGDVEAFVAYRQRGVALAVQDTESVRVFGVARKSARPHTRRSTSCALDSAWCLGKRQTNEEELEPN